ncbi:trypsin-like serine peptidase [Staphylococcus intermedius]|uniref:Serine protease n=1 Tax=Staphylococcus intermedius NCTC 11048 TaxID=1141106 RepID=A0A380GB08_STAIN|nr:trypsin-like serine protease [Staphylococcus intermedius]PCF65611.1 serine protease [Staphylococcus intermedius]PCF81290.1 serine protease [Staphylococcus intermedius]PCF82573.1 serine protease [Staphylococcus intermedius]PCF87272.1 serine protease [Staphylococcus intermedius]PNZ54058.1 serine protease [Staphylococcus intermedius NCTC 11048]
MKKLRLVMPLFLVCLILSPVDAAYAKDDQTSSPDKAANPHQEVVPDTVKDRHSKYTAKYISGTGKICTAILISSTAAVTAKHCGGTKSLSPAGTIYPGASGDKTPFGYMNIREYIPHPKYDIAVIKGLLRDQDKFYQYYIKPFTTKVTGYSDDTFDGFVGKEVYSYGYPLKGGVFKQYRSDGEIISYHKYIPLLSTNMPASEGQSGSGVFKKDGPFVGIVISSRNGQADALPFTEEIAQWINENAK